MTVTASPLTESTESTEVAASPRYLEPGWITRNVFNRMMERLAKMGVSLRG